MIFLRSIRLGRLLALCALLAPAIASAQGTVTIDLTASSLEYSSGAALPTGNLVLLIADTTGSGFGPLLPGSSLSDGSLLNGNDQIIGATTIQAIEGDPPGTAMASFTGIPLGTSPYTNLAPGDSLAVVWFSDLTSSSTVLTAGEVYGLFTTTSPADGSDPWLVPAASGDIDVIFETQAVGGSNPDSDALAMYTAIPEPATSSLIVGAAACLAALAHTLRPRKRNDPVG